ncbi:MAG: hypothetical protein AAF891_00060 [Pseudomonadota bacterium]
MLTQANFDRSEEISFALCEQDGLERSLIGYLDGKLAPGDQHIAFALIHGMAHARRRAEVAAAQIARSGVPDG